MTTYLAVARITVGSEPKQQVKDLRDGLERVIYELHDRGISLDDIERDVETAIEGIRWEQPSEDDDDDE